MSSTILSYNLHGFNQGKHLLNYYCTKGTDDILFLQEHWLSPDSLNKIDFVCPGYYAFSVSSFESSVSSGLLRGRPYGGLAILVKNNYRSSCKLIRKHERFIAILFNDLLLINVYFPSPSRMDCKEETIELIAQIEELIIDTPDISDVIIGGDFNCNLDVNNWSSNIISDLMKNFSLKSCNSLVQNINNLDYTYFHETLGQYSYLDYFLVSPALADLVQKHEICSDEPNLSDHMPIRIYIDNSVIALCAPVNSFSESKHCYINDWKKADLLSYYELTRRGLQPLLSNVLEKDSVFVSHTENKLKLVEDACIARKLINSTYTAIVEILLNSAQQSVPVIKVDANKFWWDQELKELKEKCINSNNLWIAAGRPRCGHLFDTKMKDKREYKKTVNRKKIDSKNYFTNDLHEALLSKDNSRFWKTWKNSFSDRKSSVSPTINGISDPSLVTEMFGKYFSGICFPNPIKDETSKNIFNEEFHDYVGDCIDVNSEFSVELIDNIISEMSKGKAAGIDNLTIEHVQHAHPIIVTILKRLFSSIIHYSIVPDLFGQGLTVPLIKENDNNSNNKTVDQFRAITISPVISKIFEHCILRNYSDYFITNPSQFGFKKQLGCRHVIYCVKQVVDYFTRAGSTVNICTIDISKAFDKVNYYILFSKLLKRYVPKNIVKTLVDWYTNSYIYVKWSGVLSTCYKISSGVRQGGVLSPVLFNLYVDDVLIELQRSQLGCVIKGNVLNSFMYADDLIILSVLVSDLQRLIDIAVESLDNIMLSVNSKKCCCMRVGKRFASSCHNIKVCKNEIEWANEFRYLGVYLNSGHILKFNKEFGKKKFYRSINCIISKTGNKHDITLSLCKSFCIPKLLYCVESMSLTKTEKKRLGHPVDRVLFRLFKTFDMSIINYCRQMFNILPLEYVIDLYSLNFLVNCSTLNNSVVKSVFNLGSSDTINNIANLYNIDLNNYNSWKYCMWKSFIGRS